MNLDVVLTGQPKKHFSQYNINNTWYATVSMVRNLLIVDSDKQQKNK